MKILVCTDGSNHSEAIIEKAVEIANRIGDVEASIIYVDDLEQSMVPSHAISHFKEEKREIEEKILNEAKKSFEAEGIKVDTMLEKGKPASVISRKASKGDYELIILGNRGHSGMERFFLGSVTNAVAQQTDTDVYIVKK